MQVCGQTVEPEAVYDDLRVALDPFSKGYRLAGTVHQCRATHTFNVLRCFRSLAFRAFTLNLRVFSDCIAAVATVGAGAASNPCKNTRQCAVITFSCKSRMDLPHGVSDASNSACANVRVKMESIILGKVLIAIATIICSISFHC